MSDDTIHKEIPIHYQTPFMKVASMNEAFSNPVGSYYNLDINRLRSQCTNIGDEFVELLEALGLDHHCTEYIRKAMQISIGPHDWNKAPQLLEVRDALCDIQVFAQGGQHFMGVDGDADMNAVVAGVMTRFIKNFDDKLETIDKHAKKGVIDVYFEGDYPTMVMKSASDQPDAPKGKFLKSASFKETVFPAVEPTPGQQFCASL